MATTSIPVMNWSGEDIAENLRLYKDKMNLYFLDENITDNTKKARKILRSIGDDVLRKLYGSSLTEDDKKDPAKLYKFFWRAVTSHKRQLPGPQTPTHVIHHQPRRVHR